MPPDAVDEAVKAVLRAESQSVFQENWRAYQLLKFGVPVEYALPDGRVKHDRARLVAWDDPFS
ncbi:MAG: hypothetical protein V9G10_13430 [Candidatus Nanopelagicales bacterium]